MYVYIMSVKYITLAYCYNKSNEAVQVCNKSVQTFNCSQQCFQIPIFPLLITSPS